LAEHGLVVELQLLQCSIQMANEPTSSGHRLEMLLDNILIKRLVHFCQELHIIYFPFKSQAVLREI